jgi:hypothetical protein
VPAQRIAFFSDGGASCGYTSNMIRNPEDIPLLFPDPVIEVYLKDVDRTLIRSMLQKTATQRIDVLTQMNLHSLEGKRNRERARAAAAARSDRGN